MNEKYYRVAKTISRWKIDTPFENWRCNGQILGCFRDAVF